MIQPYIYIQIIIYIIIITSWMLWIVDSGFCFSLWRTLMVLFQIVYFVQIIIVFFTFCCRKSQLFSQNVGHAYFGLWGICLSLWGFRVRLILQVVQMSARYSKIVALLIQVSAEHMWLTLGQEFYVLLTEMPASPPWGFSFCMLWPN